VQLFNISVIAVALAMDAFAVAIAAGVTLKKISFRGRPLRPGLDRGF